MAAGVSYAGDHTQRDVIFLILKKDARGKY